MDVVILSGLLRIDVISRVIHSMLTPSIPAVILAPMEGVTDAPMRALQGETGAFTFAVSEFLRISHQLPPESVFYHHVPELRTGGVTPSKLPVQVQLLGGNSTLLAEAALFVHQLGATAIDINFGCPARTVNRHDGGATLLQYPKRIREIVRAVRDALPENIPVSAKLRLGWDCVDSIYENAAMAAEGGASWLTIHARTRTQGYAPPVFWPHIGRVREQLKIPIVANGDIWTFEGFLRCREETGCNHFMLGRGALANPGLANQIGAELGIREAESEQEINWASQFQNLIKWMKQFNHFREEKALYRMKQWLRIASTCGNFSQFNAIKLAKKPEEIFASLQEMLVN
jgi:tRNA-dihydrouridine synthase C